MYTYADKKNATTGKKKAALKKEADTIRTETSITTEKQKHNNSVESAIIQMIEIQSLFNPNDTKVREKEITIDTDKYSFKDKVSILTHHRNQKFLTNEKYIQFAQELENDFSGWSRLIQDCPELVDSARATYKKIKIPSCIDTVAKSYIDCLQILHSQKIFEQYQFPSKSFFTAKKHDGFNPQEANDLFSLVKREEQDKKQIISRQQMEEYYKRGSSYIMLATYFYTEIPEEFENRNLFLVELSQLRVKLEEKHEQENVTEKYIEELLKRIVVMVKEIHEQCSQLFPGAIPQTFKESLDPMYQMRIDLIKRRVQMALEPYAVLIAAIVPGSKLKYRGSLADGIKNFTKSQETPPPELRHGDFTDLPKKAIPVNLNAFDIDAFIELPDALWDKWEEFHLIPDRKDQAIKGKLILTSWLTHLESLAAKGNFGAYYEIPKVKELIALEEMMRFDMSSLAGYKKKIDDKADFDVVLQPQSKTKKSELYGKLYPLGELSRGGSAYEELMAEFTRLKETDIDKEAVKIREPNVIITTESGLSASEAQKRLMNPLRRLKVIDLAGAKDINTEQLVQMIQDGTLPFLEALIIDVDQISFDQIIRIFKAFF